MKRPVILMMCVLFAGCGSQNAEDLKAMRGMTEKLSSAVGSKLASSNYAEASNLALVSCVFAREVNSVQGREAKNPTPELAMTRTEPPEETKRSIVVLGGGVVSCAAVWKQTQEAALQADHEVKGLDTKTYDDILGSVLSKQEMVKLRDIRERRKYWPSVEQTLR